MPTKWLAGVLGVIIFSNMNSDDESSVQQDEEIDRGLGVSRGICCTPQLSTRVDEGEEESRKKRASTLTVDKGEMFLKKKGHQVEVVTAVEEQ